MEEKVRINGDGKASKEVTIAEVVRNVQRTVSYLFTKWPLILGVAFCFGLLGITYAWLQKPVYIAEMSFTTESESGSKLGGYASIAAQFGFDLGGGSNNIFEGDNLMELLKSLTLVQKTLLTPSGNGSRLMIDEYLANEDFKPGENDDVVKFDTDPANNTRFEDSLLQGVYNKIVTSELEVQRKDKKLSIIILRMKGNNEAFAKRFVELLTTNAIQFYTDYKSRKSRQNVELLQRQADSVRVMLFGGMNDVAAMNDLNVNPTRQSLRTPSQRRQVDVQVNSILYGELLKNLELSKLTLRKETPLIQVIDRPILPLEKKKMGRLKGGINFAFIGGILMIVILLVRRYLGSIQLNPAA
jgi:hypothetical protein